MTGAQLPLDLGHRPAFGREDFLVAPCNAEAVVWLDRWPDWNAPGLALFGPPGSGKSHLLAAFAAIEGARPIVAAALDEAMVPALVDGRRLIVLDDLDGLISETALFHLFNLARAGGCALVVAGSIPPARMAFRLPDLASRLKILPAVGIGLPDDSLLAAVMVKQFADRQIPVGEEVVAYLIGRVERSFAAIRKVVAELDRRSLAERRPITVPLARAVLEEMRD